MTRPNPTQTHSITQATQRTPNTGEPRRLFLTASHLPTKEEMKNLDGFRKALTSFPFPFAAAPRAPLTGHSAGAKT